MMHTLRQFFRRRTPKSGPCSIPEGQRVYAIGDIHGRLDLFAAIASAIEADDAARGPAETTVILLGDLVDRGPDSAEVLAGARAWQQRRNVRILRGNHEDMFLMSLRRENALRNFLRFGGLETVLSYPVDPAAFRAADYGEAQEMIRRAVPPEDIDFIRTFEDRILIGDYLFVHAGIQPGIPLEEQSVQDLRWIREPFLNDAGDHGCVVVHGHTITDKADVRHNRIGIDTGAFMSGRLTALGLEGVGRWLIEAGEIEGRIAVETRVLETC